MSHDFAPEVEYCSKCGLRYDLAELYGCPGSHIDWSGKVAPLTRSHDERVTELLEANNRNVQARRAAEAALRTAEERLQALTAATNNKTVGLVIDGGGMVRALTRLGKN